MAAAFCVTPSGALYVLESGSDRLLRYSSAGILERQFGGFGWGEDAFDRPVDIAAINDLEIYVADFGNDRIVRFDRTLGLTSVLETRTGPVPFRFPLSVTVTDFGQLLVVDGEYGRVIELGKEDRISRIFGGSGLGPGFLRKPVKVRSDGHERVLVQDDPGLVVFDTYGKHIRTLGKSSTGNFISFDHYHEGVILLDSNAVRAFSISGEKLWETEIPAAGDSVKRTPVDIRTGGGRIFILYPDRIVLMPEPAGIRREP